MARRPRSRMLPGTEGGIAMGALWTLVTFAFTFGVFAVIGFALWHVFVAARDNSPRLRH
jgi:hypothetical protein